MKDKRFIHKGWLLVETGHNYYHAIKGSRRKVIGGVKHGDHAELMRRFKRIVDELEGE